MSLRFPLPSRDAQSRGVHAWCLYDWANSAYVTTVAVAVLPAYFAAAVVPPGGAVVAGARLSAATLWGALVGCTALAVFILAPLLGAAADRGGARRRFLAAFCLMGSAASVLLLFAGPGLVWRTMGLFFVAQVGFVGGNVFYDALLPHVAAPRDLDRVSGRGFAYGYLGGGVQFALALGLVAGHARLGLSEDLAARLAMAGAGLWWGGFGLWALSGVPEPPGQAVRDGGLGPGLRAAFSRLRRMPARARALPGLLPFLAAYLFYNDGVQTVISMATIFGKTELGLSNTVLMLTLLMIQFVSIPGALLFSRLAGAWGSRRALMLAVALWAGVAVYAHGMGSATEYCLMGVVVGLVMGGSQALSRSLYARLVPRENSAEFFGWFSVTSRLSAVLGPFVFAGVAHATGSSRGAVLWLVAFFVLGLGLLMLVPDSRGGRGVSQREAP
ncbi:MFS transporter [Desulfocurvus sp. DL9XJH121]